MRILPEQYDEKTDGGAGYSYGYDSRDRLVSVTGPDGATEHRYVYDPAGNLIKDITAKGCLTADSDDDRVGTVYTYDLTGNVTSVRIPTDIRDGSVRYRLTTYAYDKMARCTEEKRYLDYQDAESRKGRVHTINYTYDAAGRLTGVGDSTGACVEYQYDTCGRQTLERIKIDGNTWKETGREYSPAGRLIRITESADEKGCGRKSGNITAATDGNGNTVTYRYNRMNLLSERKDASGAQELFLYDMEGRLCEHRDRDGRRQLYRYNMYGSPTLHENPAERLRESWEYDAMGRLTTATGGGMQYRYTYYDNGRLKEKQASGRTLLAYAYDLSGNVVSRRDLTGKETCYGYDRCGRLKSVTDNGRVLAAYTCHGDGRVESRTIADTIRTDFRYDADKNLTCMKTVDSGTDFLVHPPSALGV